MAPLLPTAAAARAAANLSALVTFIPASSSGLGLLVPGESEATIAAMLPAPFTPIGFIVKGAGAARPRFFPSMWRLVDKATSMTALRVSGLRSDASRTWHGFHSSSSSPDSEEPVTPPPSYPTDNDLITLMNLTDLNMEEEVLFRRAFNERYQNFRIADVGDYLDNQKWTFEELRYILKIMYRKAGPHRQLMELLIREDMLHGYARAKRNSMRILY
uniref:Uncharacterized protein n=1 Tax=Arundo donax TaxID=35708 RepID=A0A0A9H130_ARUDO